jgi:DNA segregation ATPase FtsK/SpoIIIE-like protein
MVSRNRVCWLAVGAAVLVAAGQATAQAPDQATVYQQPPQPIAAILDSDPTPIASLGPDRQRLALFGRSNLPPISELAEPSLRLAGYRINPRNNGPAESRVAWLTGLSLKPVDGGEAASGELDELYDQAVRIVTETRRASISGVQRRLKIGYNRAARLIEEMQNEKTKILT